MNKYNFIIIFLVLFLLYLSVVAQSGNKTDSLLQVVSSVSKPEEKSELLLDLADLNINADMGKALDYCEQALKIADEARYEKGKMHAYLILARIYYFRSELDEAMEYASLSKSIAEDLGDDHNLALALDAIGVIYYDIGNQAKSSEYFFSSLKIYENLDNKEGIGANLCRIGTLYLDQKDYNKAEEYYVNSIKIAREINSQEGIASNLNNLAKVYSEEKDYNKALQTYQEALEINIKTGNAYLEASNYLNIAEVYLKKKDYRSAIEKAHQAEKIYEKIGNKVKVAKSQILLSEIYLNNDQLSESEALAKKSMRIGIEQGFKEIIADAAEVLYHISISVKDSAAAFRYFILEKQFQDSLFFNEKQKNLTALELQYKFEKNEQELVMERERRNVAIIIISGCLLFSIAIIFLISKQLRLKAKKLQLEKEVHMRELEFKNKEMVLNVMSLMKKNEMLAELSEKLVHLAKEAPTEESRDTIKKVAKEVQKSQEEEIWKEFSTRFKEVHGEFYDKLLKKYPSLTPNDLKLCAFLRLNMSSKDIAELTGQRVSSLETARYRLRQKLGIANSDINLITFLSSI
jgi:tetratricopeptide (TPR) repeat protein